MVAAAATATFRTDFEFGRFCGSPGLSEPRDPGIQGSRDPGILGGRFWNSFVFFYWALMVRSGCPLGAPKTKNIQNEKKDGCGCSHSNFSDQFRFLSILWCSRILGIQGSGNPGIQGSGNPWGSFLKLLCVFLLGPDGQIRVLPGSPKNEKH